MKFAHDVRVARQMAFDMGRNVRRSGDELVIRQVIVNAWKHFIMEIEATYNDAVIVDYVKTAFQRGWQGIDDDNVNNTREIELPHDVLKALERL